VAALHSFWYDEAAEAFRMAQKADPDFAMAYWGEAMTYNHPLWTEQDIASARQTLRRLAPTRKQRLAKASTDREKAFLEAVEILYGEGDKLTRDIAYSKAMEKLFEQYPDDHEVACFYALSLLGTVRSGDVGFRQQMKSAAILHPVFQENPNHPGAAHYLIHSYDDPDHAPLGLPAAMVYAEIAPAAPHALHMPTHIFVQHGMWERVAASNEAAYAASDQWVKRKNLSLAKRDYHAFSWMQYSYLQLGRYEEAWKPVELVQDVADKTGDAGVRRYAGSMKARYIIETERWQDLPLPDSDSFAGRRYAGMGAAKQGNWAKAEEAAKRLKALREQNESEGKEYESKSMAIMEKEVRALVLLGQGEKDEALRLAKEATAIEASMDPPSGPPYPIKPSHELYGEILLQTGRAEEAVKQFEATLLRMPERAASLLGLAQASSQAGDTETARRAYNVLLENWKGADPGLPELEEARKFDGATDGGS
jgi:tetratricopeptide (TPR) repeat protein